MLTPSRRSRFAATLMLAAALIAVPTARAQAPDQLHTATQQELDIVKLLLEHGANSRAIARNGTTALEAALEGSSDMDRTTTGQCQTATVKAIVESDRSLRLAEDSAAFQAARRAGCKDALALLVQ